MSIIKKFKDFKDNFAALDDIADGFGHLADKLNEKLELRMEIMYLDGYPDIPSNLPVMLVLEYDPLLMVYGGSVLKKIRKKSILEIRLEKLDATGREESGLGSTIKSFFTPKKEIIILTVKQGKKTLALRFAGKKIKEKFQKLKKFAEV
ncbi:MAG: hypothetical protein GX197_07655 [Firmicutes bacterium]|nr:hypothetical protein [Bacillota bacterium]